MKPLCILRVYFQIMLCLGIGCCIQAHAQGIPGSMNIQGVLNTSSGQALPNGIYSIRFSLYEGKLGGTPVWQEVQNSVVTQQGVFSTTLGNIKPLNLPFDRLYFLGIQLGNEPEFTPRIELTSTPYSLMAKNIEDNAVSNGKIQANAVTIDKIASPIISSINGIANDGGNIKIIAGANVSITNNDQDKSITITATGGGSPGTGSITQLTEGNGISIQNPNGPFSNIGLKPNILLGPGGSLGILNQNNAAVGSFSSDGNQNGFFSLSNRDLINTFGVTHTSFDRQPLLYMNNRSGRQIINLQANETGDGEMNLKTAQSNSTIQLKANENAGGLVNVFNQNGNVATRLTTSASGNGRLMINSVDNILVLDLKTNSGGGGFLSLFNDESTEAVRLSTSENRGGILSVRNRSGNTAVNLSTNGVGDGGVFVRSGANTPVGDLSVNVNGGGFFTISNQDPVEVFRITTTANRQGSMRMNNRLGNRTAELTSNEFSDGEFTLHSVLTNPTVRLTANDNAGGLVNIFNQQGLIASQSTETDGSGDFRLNNPSGEEILRLNTVNGGGRLKLNNRLGNPVALVQASEFSDGEIILNSVLNTPTVRLAANDNAGGLINVFSQNNKLSARLTEINDAGDFKLFNKQNIGIVNLSSFLGDGSILLNNNQGFESAGMVGSSTGGFMYVADGTKTSGLNLRGVLNGGVGGGELELYNVKGIKTFLLTTNYNSEGLLQIRSKSDKTKSRIELGSDPNESGFVKVFNKEAKGIVSLQSNASTQEGLIRVASKSIDTLDRLNMGGDTKGNGYLNLFNSKGLNTSFLGHNEFGDGSIELKNNLGNLGGFFTAFKDGGSIAVTDGKPGTNHRATLGSTLFGGRTTIFNASNLMTHESTVQSNGEGIARIVNPNDITKSRVELGGTFNKDGYIATFDAKNKRNIDLLANAEGAGIITTYKNDKIQTTLNSTIAGGNIEVFNAAGLNTSQIGHLADGRGKIEVGHSNGIKVARMTSNTDGSGYIGVDNIDKNEVVRLTANANKGGGIGVKSGLNKDIVTIFQTPTNDGSILVYNASGNNTSAIAHLDDGRGKIEVGTADGTKVARMSANSDGSGFITVNNVDKLEVVRITANTGKGGGIGIRNGIGNDIINLTQTNANGTILVNNDKGGLLATMTNNTANGGFIGNKDQNGKDAVWMTSGAQGGGLLHTFNNLGKTATTINADANNIGNVSVHGSAGNEIARLSGTSNGVGLLKTFNGAGTNVAGITNNSVSSAGYVYIQNSNGKELARMTSTGDGTTGSISTDNSSGVNLAGLTSSSLGAGYVYANASNGKTIGVITATSNSGGIIAANNPAATTVSYLTSNTLNGGYLGVANSAGGDRARLTTTATGSGHISASNPTGTNVVNLSVSTNNHGEISTSNASGNIINALGATGTGQGYIAANNNSGQERAFMTTGNVGGEIGVNDNTGKDRVIMAGSGLLEVRDVDGSYLSLYSSGSSANMVLVDKFQHPRAEVKSGIILAKGPNGVEHSFMSSATAPNLGYIGVCNSNIVGSPVKAGMYTNANNQGVLFADIKNFKMDYPGKPDKQIWYGSLEGPELAAYIRGTAKMIGGKANVVFPDHYAQVANASTMTVLITPLSGKSKGIAVVKKSSTGFDAEELLEGIGSYEFDWEVKCIRKGHEDFEVVRNKTDDPKPFIGNSPQVLETRSVRNALVDPIVKEVITRQQ